jgi:regulator of sigma D
MLERLKSAKERWGGTHELIDRWLHERQELLVHFFSVDGLDPYAPEDTPLTIKVKAFCQLLVDYLSAGHFEIYEQLIREAKDFNDGGEELAAVLLPKLEATTSQMIAFNDKYSCDENVDKYLESIDSDLAKMGELMANRFEMEDQLIQVLHEAHRDKVA